MVIIMKKIVSIVLILALLFSVCALAVADIIEEMLPSTTEQNKGPIEAGKQYCGNDAINQTVIFTYVAHQTAPVSITVSVAPTNGDAYKWLWSQGYEVCLSVRNDTESTAFYNNSVRSEFLGIDAEYYSATTKGVFQNCFIAEQLKQYTVELSVVSRENTAIGEYTITICNGDTHIDTYSSRIEPTCVKSGIEAVCCTYCHDIISETEIPATGHDYSGEWVTAKEPTCTSEGEKNHYCSVCNELIEEETITCLPHTPGDMITLSEPTCINSGMKASFCTVCGAVVKTEAIPPTGHTLSEWNIDKEPSCQGQGLRSKECIICHDVVYREPITANEHIPSDVWVEVLAPTCVGEGKRVQKCTVCDKILAEEAIPATGHMPGIWTTTKEPTCISDGIKEQYCTVCHATLSAATNIPALGHTPVDWVTTKEATCMECGKKEKKCAICGSTLEAEEIPALGHDYSEYEVTREATKDNEGEEICHCNHCGEERVHIIPKLERILGIF